MGGLTLILLIPILANIEFGSSGCPVDSRPEIPVLISMQQDPETHVVTATVEDRSDNEQWFSLSRTIISRNNVVVAVGTDIPVPDGDNMPVNRETGRTVTIADRGLVNGENPQPDTEYVYTVRAMNCFFPSDRSNDLKITTLPAS